MVLSEVEEQISSLEVDEGTNQEKIKVRLASIVFNLLKPDVRLADTLSANANS